MPSGFKIVQSTLLKFDGFKLNLENVESVIKCLLYFLLVLIRKLVFISKQETLFAFQKLNNLRLENY